MIRKSVIFTFAIGTLACLAALYMQRGTRGLKLEVFSNTRFAGEPTTTKVVRHLHFGPTDSLHQLTLKDRSSGQYTGWIYAPRAGRYEFALTTNDRAWLHLDDKSVINHHPKRRSRTKRKVRLAKGFHTIRVRFKHVRGDSQLAIHWRLPSGYMNLESIPPAFLQPDTPKPTSASITLQVLAVILFLGLVIVAFWQSVHSAVSAIATPKHRPAVIAGLIIVTLGLGIRLYDLNAAGETADEWAYASAGRIYLSNIGHGDFSSRYWHANEEHPPVGKYLYGLVSHLSGTDSYTPLRVTSAFLNTVVILVTFLLGYRYFGLWVGIGAGGLLTVMPHFVAHGKVAALDSPSTMLATLCVACFYRGLEGHRNYNRWFLGSGLLGSLAMATKFSNVLLFVFMVAAHVTSQWRRLRKNGVVEVPWTLFILPIIPFALLIGIWPWLWDNPFGQLVATLTHWDYPIREWFLGRFRQPPPHYFFVYFLVTMPVLLLAPFLFALWQFRKMKGEGCGSLSQRTWVVVTILWFVTPFLWTLSVLKQDGIRYIYNMFPPLSLLIGIGIVQLSKSLARRFSQPVGIVQVSMVGLLIGYTGWQASTVHPYYLDYYSEAVGGTYPSWKNRRFEVGWWGQGMNRAVEFVNANADPKDTWECYGVVNHTVDGIRTDLRRVRKKARWLIVGYVSPGKEQRKGYDEVHRVSLQGAPLAIVYRRTETTDVE